MFDDDFLDSLPDDPEDAAHLMCKHFKEIDSTIEETQEEYYYDQYIEAFAAMEAFVKTIGLPFIVPTLVANKEENIQRIQTFFYEILKPLDKREINNKLSRARDKYKARFGGVFLYLFSDGDLKRIQELINELRDLAVQSELFDAKHKERILKKLEGLQMEMHKKMSSLDKLWGLIGEAGVALGKFGKDAKPFVDRIREIAQITWRTQARAEELPSGTTLPLLSHGQSEGKELD